jgi:hypothetical protein
MFKIGQKLFLSITISNGDLCWRPAPMLVDKGTTITIPSGACAIAPVEMPGQGSGPPEGGNSRSLRVFLLVQGIFFLNPESH